MTDEIEALDRIAEAVADLRVILDGPVVSIDELATRLRKIHEIAAGAGARARRRSNLAGLGRRR